MTFKVSPRDTCELFSNITWNSGCPDYNRRDSSEYDLPLSGSCLATSRWLLSSTFSFGWSG